jgi:putative two-component system response regulator
MIAKSDATSLADDAPSFSSARHLDEMSANASALEEQQSAKIMIVDDEPIIIKVAQKSLHASGFNNVHSSCDPATAFRSILDYQPDALILDIMMPEVSGLDILRQLRQTDATRQLPVIVLTASDDRETKLQALNLGATDFLAKPVDSLELTPRVRNAIRSKHFHDHLKNYSQELELAVQRKTAELELSRREVLQCLARAAEFRDDDTGQHILRVGRYAAIIAQSMGMTPDYVDMIEQAAQLHDVGKIGIPDSILQKPGKLTAGERQEMQLHSGYGKKILQSVTQQGQPSTLVHSQIGGQILEATRSPLLQMAHRIALTHHERWDGTGYPIGLAGHDIPLEGRITAVADVFDALSSQRPYKKAFPVDECFRILNEGCGTHFEPEVLHAFFRRRDEAVQVQMDFLDTDRPV